MRTAAKTTCLFFVPLHVFGCSALWKQSKKIMKLRQSSREIHTKATKQHQKKVFFFSVALFEKKRWRQTLWLIDWRPKWGDNLLIISESSAECLTLMERKWCPSNSSNSPASQTPLPLFHSSCHPPLPPRPALPPPWKNALSTLMSPPHISHGSYKMPASSSCAQGRKASEAGKRADKTHWYVICALHIDAPNLWWSTSFAAFLVSFIPFMVLQKYMFHVIFVAFHWHQVPLTLCHYVNLLFPLWTTFPKFAAVPLQSLSIHFATPSFVLFLFSSFVIRRSPQFSWVATSVFAAT